MCHCSGLQHTNGMHTYPLKVIERSLLESHCQETIVYKLKPIFYRPGLWSKVNMFGSRPLSVLFELALWLVLFGFGRGNGWYLGGRLSWDFGKIIG